MDLDLYYISDLVKQKIAAESFFLSTTKGYVTDDQFMKKFPYLSICGNTRFTHSLFFEVLWTSFSLAIVWCLLVPSFFLLYIVDMGFKPRFTILVMGHQ